MLGIPVRYLVKHPTAATPLVVHPLDTWVRLHEAYVGAHEPQGPPQQYLADDDWEAHLHAAMGAPWPCPLIPEFWDVFHTVLAELQASGIRPGPESFRDWNDGDAAFVRSLWCLIQHRSLRTVVETGVAHGVTSRIMLEALDRNGAGHLWSVDLPPLEREWRKQVGMAVAPYAARRWSYIEGTSRLHLPALLARLHAIDLFVHDSLHTERNVRFELGQAWPALNAGGAIVVDDIDANNGFSRFLQRRDLQTALIAEAEPVRPDPRRFNQKGLFGIVLAGTAA
jgi:predicted O-methyltransferase YrrM